MVELEGRGVVILTGVLELPRGDCARCRLPEEDDVLDAPVAGRVPVHLRDAVWHVRQDGVVGGVCGRPIGRNGIGVSNSTNSSVSSSSDHTRHHHCTASTSNGDDVDNNNIAAAAALNGPETHSPPPASPP